METDNIQFEEMNPWKDIDYTQQKMPAPSKRFPTPIKGRYASLYDEIKKKCNPLNYMSPYDYEKVKISNELTALIEQNKSDVEELKRLRKRAVEELGIQFATIELYEELTYNFNPKKYVNNPTHLRLINEVYHNILMNADNIEMLERIKQDDTKVCRTAGIVLVNKKKEEEIEKEWEKQETMAAIVYIVSSIVILFILISIAQN